MQICFNKLIGRNFVHSILWRWQEKFCDWSWWIFNFRMMLIMMCSLMFKLFFLSVFFEYFWIPWYERLINYVYRQDFVNNMNNTVDFNFLGFSLWHKWDTELLTCRINWRIVRIQYLIAMSTVLSTRSCTFTFYFMTKPV